VPITVSELENSQGKSSLRGKILEFLSKNSGLAFKLKEIHIHFLELDKKGENKYKGKEKILYRIIYNYLRDFSFKSFVIHKGDYYYYKKDGEKLKKE